MALAWRAPSVSGVRREHLQASRYAARAQEVAPAPVVRACVAATVPGMLVDPLLGPWGGLVRTVRRRERRAT